MKEQILSYELILPQRIYPHLDRLFSVFKNQVNLYIPKLWNEEGFKLLSQKGSAVGILKKEFPTPIGLPSRVFRNVLELTRQTQTQTLKIYSALPSPFKTITDKTRKTHLNAKNHHIKEQKL